MTDKPQEIRERLVSCKVQSLASKVVQETMVGRLLGRARYLTIVSCITVYLEGLSAAGTVSAFTSPAFLHDSRIHISRRPSSNELTIVRPLYDVYIAPLYYVFLTL